MKAVGFIMYKLSIIFMALLLASCGLIIGNPDDLKNSIRMQSGAEGCNGCNNIKTFTTSTFGFGLYATKGSNGLNTGDRIGAGVSLGATNGGGGFSGPLNLSQERVAYAKTLLGEGHLFSNESAVSGKYPFRFFITVHNNTSFANQEVYLVLSEDNYLKLPGFNVRNRSTNKNCNQLGCLWDEDYVISAQFVNDAIKTNKPLTIFVGFRRNKEVVSKDGYNKSYAIFNEGVPISIPPTYLKAFLDGVRSKLTAPEAY